MKRKRLLQIVAVVAVLHLPLLFVIQWRRVAEPNRRRIESPETPLTRELRGKVLDVSRETIDDLVNNLDDDWINQHSELYLDDTYQSSHMFDAVVMNLATRRLVFELRQHLSEEECSTFVLKVFEKYFARYELGLEARTRAVEEVARVLQTDGKRELTMAEFHQNMSIGIRAFPEGWNDVERRANGVLNSTFLVATFCSMEDVSRTIRRFVDSQLRINKRLEAIGYPNVEHGNVGLEREFLVSVMWYSCNRSQIAHERSSAAIRKAVTEALNQKKMKKLERIAIDWSADMEKYGSATNSPRSPVGIAPTTVDRLRWSCSDTDRISISNEVVGCLR